jgi:hypothetical protein
MLFGGKLMRQLRQAARGAYDNPQRIRLSRYLAGSGQAVGNRLFPKGQDDVRQFAAAKPAGFYPVNGWHIR